MPCRSVPNQEYCCKSTCQRARKRLWQKQQLQKDPDYSDNQKSSQKAWRTKNPGYMREYRSRSPAYSAKNRSQQHRRNEKRKKAGLIIPASPIISSSMIVNMDELQTELVEFLRLCRPANSESGFIVKMDELSAQKQPFSVMFFRPLLSGNDCKERTSSPCRPMLVTL